MTLTTFDTESLVRAVAACSTPTVVAIGHEGDQSLVDRRLTGLGCRVEAGVNHLRQRCQQRASLRQRAVDLERRIDTVHRTAVTGRLGALETRIEHGLQTTELLE
ncbi:MAG: Exonuclease VII, large subunit [halophilic archaeon J07HX5]|nr:MAG: Exonuclease VII, large subunit [halophilic archaeon J07HX5]